MATRRAVLLIQKLFTRNSNGNISRARMSISLKFQILYQEHTTIEEVAPYGHPSCSSPDTDVFERKSRGNISRGRMSISLKFRVLYQEHMTIEEVARYVHPSGSSTDTEVFRTKFNRDYLERQNVNLADISNFVSGAYDNRGGGTMWGLVELFS